MHSKVLLFIDGPSLSRQERDLRTVIVSRCMKVLMGLGIRPCLKEDQQKLKFSINWGYEIGNLVAVNRAHRLRKWLSLDVESFEMLESAIEEIPNENLYEENFQLWLTGLQNFVKNSLIDYQWETPDLTSPIKLRKVATPESSHRNFVLIFTTFPDNETSPPSEKNKGFIPSTLMKKLRELNMQFFVIDLNPNSGATNARTKARRFLSMLRCGVVNLKDFDMGVLMPSSDLRKRNSFALAAKIKLKVSEGDLNVGLHCLSCKGSCSSPKVPGTLVMLGSLGKRGILWGHSPPSHQFLWKWCCDTDAPPDLGKGVYLVSDESGKDLYTWQQLPCSKGAILALLDECLLSSPMKALLFRKDERQETLEDFRRECLQSLQRSHLQESSQFHSLLLEPWAAPQAIFPDHLLTEARRKSEVIDPLTEDSVTMKPVALVSKQQERLERKVLKAIPGRRHLRSGRNLEMVKRGMVAGCLKKIQAPDPILTKFDSITQPQKRESCEFREFRQDDLTSLVEDLLKYKAEIIEKGDFDERIQCHRVIVEEIQNFLARCSPQQNVRDVVASHFFLGPKEVRDFLTLEQQVKECQFQVLIQMEAGSGDPDLVEEVFNAVCPFLRLLSLSESPQGFTSFLKLLVASFLPKVLDDYCEKWKDVLKEIWEELNLPLEQLCDNPDDSPTASPSASHLHSLPVSPRSVRSNPSLLSALPQPHSAENSIMPDKEGRRKRTLIRHPSLNLGSEKGVKRVCRKLFSGGKSADPSKAKNKPNSQSPGSFLVPETPLRKQRGKGQRQTKRKTDGITTIEESPQIVTRCRSRNEKLSPTTISQTVQAASRSSFYSQGSKSRNFARGEQSLKTQWIQGHTEPPARWKAAPSGPVTRRSLFTRSSSWVDPDCSTESLEANDCDLGTPLKGDVHEVLESQLVKDSDKEVPTHTGLLMEASCTPFKQDIFDKFAPIRTPTRDSISESPLKTVTKDVTLKTPSKTLTKAVVSRTRSQMTIKDGVSETNQKTPAKTGVSETPSKTPVRRGVSQTPSKTPTYGGTLRTPSRTPAKGCTPRKPAVKGDILQTPSKTPAKTGVTATPLKTPVRGYISQTPSKTPTYRGTLRTPRRTPAKESSSTTPGKPAVQGDALKNPSKTPAKTGVSKTSSKTPVKRDISQTPSKKTAKGDTLRTPIKTPVKDTLIIFQKMTTRSDGLKCNDFGNPSKTPSTRGTLKTPSKSPALGDVSESPSKTPTESDSSRTLLLPPARGGTTRALSKLRKIDISKRTSRTPDKCATFGTCVKLLTEIEIDIYGEHAMFRDDEVELEETEDEVFKVPTDVSHNPLMSPLRSATLCEQKWTPSKHEMTPSKRKATSGDETKTPLKTSGTLGETPTSSISHPSASRVPPPSLSPSVPGKEGRALPPLDLPLPHATPVRKLEYIESEGESAVESTSSCGLRVDLFCTPPSPVFTPARKKRRTPGSNPSSHQQKDCPDVRLQCVMRSLDFTETLQVSVDSRSAPLPFGEISSDRGNEMFSPLEDEDDSFLKSQVMSVVSRLQSESPDQKPRKQKTLHSYLSPVEKKPPEDETPHPGTDATPPPVIPVTCSGSQCKSTPDRIDCWPNRKRRYQGPDDGTSGKRISIDRRRIFGALQGDEPVA
ncbi:unnamed protein product [Darwinula stevensoni]|uniref:Treslin STD domain-containing protein n=1 Tax=Darwinula stevensoni TaxID=69355 RepID=A0A7R9AAL6_9CRUS|nr:unnamed protein product [Darwinula stevensoni]CAG0898265.1 unnamed protein product [Darwinula stevensoni]